MAALVMVLYVHIISFHVSVIMMQEFYNACVKNGMKSNAGVFGHIMVEEGYRFRVHNRCDRQYSLP